MAMPPPTIILTASQIEFYHTNGFLLLESLTTDDELAWMRDTYDRLFDEKVGWDEGAQFDLGGTDEDGKTAALPQLLGPSNFEPKLKETIYRANVVAITKQLLGDASDMRGEHMILKPAGYGAPTPWHQDEAYWNPAFDYCTTNFWMPLQDATVESGCLWFIPGSHRWQVLNHQSIGGDVRVHGLELVEGQIDTSVGVACPIPAGGVTIHANRTLHYAGPNTTDQPRRAYIQGGGAPPVKRTEPRRFPWEEAKQTAREERAHASRKP